MLWITIRALWTSDVIISLFWHFFTHIENFHHLHHCLLQHRPRVLWNLCKSLFESRLWKASEIKSIGDVLVHLVDNITFPISPPCDRIIKISSLYWKIGASQYCNSISKHHNTNITGTTYNHHLIWKIILDIKSSIFLWSKNGL